MTRPEDHPVSPEKAPPRTTAEWITTGIASLILGTIVALVIFVWVSRQDTPAAISVSQQEAVRVTGGQFYLPFVVVNRGGETAEAVQVVAELRIGGKVEETGEQQIDFLSPGETGRGAFVFSRNPSEGEVILRVASYKSP